jgi:AcrR family transcriptional regulator
MTPRTKHPEPTRDTILSAAYGQLTKVPYQKLSMEAIAERAGVSKALLFYHFSSKRGLARAALAQGISVEMARFGALDRIDERAMEETLPRFLRMSRDWFNLISAFLEVADLTDPDDELVGLMRDMYGGIVGGIAEVLRARGVPQPRERAMLIALAIDMFGMVEVLERRPPDVGAYTAAVRGMLGLDTGVEARTGGGPG